jgi:hypothetical protein
VCGGFELSCGCCDEEPPVSDVAAVSRNEEPPEFTSSRNNFEKSSGNIFLSK